MSIRAFTPQGNTVTFTANVTAPTAVQATSGSLGATSYRIHNVGNSVIYLGFGATASDATAMANTSISGSTITMVANSVEVFTLNANQYFTAVTSSGTSAVTVLVGDGL